jgi:hypothetical protein
MIKNIFLHIGVHKTASTTIQNTLYLERAKLSDNGILYPAFIAGDNLISNHSIPIYSLFCNEPEKYHINVNFGITNREAIQELHQEYQRQIEAQIADFIGETLIISGEDISLFDIDELRNLKVWLTKITHPEVNIRVVLMCRHPVSRFRSSLLAKVYNSILQAKKVIERKLQQTHLYQNLITVLSEVIGQEHITVVRYEDAICHPFGPAGALLALVDKDLPDKIKPVLLHENPATNYETFVLLNAINRNCNHTSDYLPQLQKKFEVMKLLLEMPGQKFMLPCDLSKKVWDTLSEDVNWLCREFLRQEYHFLDEDLKPNADIWSQQTLDWLKKNILHLPLNHRKTIILELWQTINKQNTLLSATKRFRILKFILSQAITLLR